MLVEGAPGHNIILQFSRRGGDLQSIKGPNPDSMNLDHLCSTLWTDQAAAPQVGLNLNTRRLHMAMFEHHSLNLKLHEKRKEKKITQLA